MTRLTRAALLVIVLALSGCVTVNRTEGASSASAPQSEGDRRFDRAWDNGMDQRASKEETRVLAHKACDSIKEQGSVQLAILDLIRRDTDDTLDMDYASKVLAIGVISYCPEYASDFE